MKKRFISTVIALTMTFSNFVWAEGMTYPYPGTMQNQIPGQYLDQMRNQIPGQYLDQMKNPMQDSFQGLIPGTMPQGQGPMLPIQPMPVNPGNSIHNGPSFKQGNMDFFQNLDILAQFGDAEILKKIASLTVQIRQIRMDYQAELDKKVKQFKTEMDALYAQHRTQVQIQMQMQRPINPPMQQWPMNQRQEPFNQLQPQDKMYPQIPQDQIKQFPLQQEPVNPPMPQEQNNIPPQTDSFIPPPTNQQPPQLQPEPINPPATGDGYINPPVQDESTTFPPSMAIYIAEGSTDSITEKPQSSITDGDIVQPQPAPQPIPEIQPTLPESKPILVPQPVQPQPILMPQPVQPQPMPVPQPMQPRPMPIPYPMPGGQNQMPPAMPPAQDTEFMKTISDKQNQFKTELKIFKDTFLAKEKPLRQQIEDLKNQWIESVKDRDLKQYLSKKIEIAKQIEDLNDSTEVGQDRRDIDSKIFAIQQQMMQIDLQIVQKTGFKQQGDQKIGDQISQDEDNDMSTMTSQQINDSINSAYDSLTAKNNTYQSAIDKLKKAVSSGDKKGLIAAINKYQKIYKEGRDKDQKIYRNITDAKQIIVSNTDIEIPDKIEDAYNSYIHNRELIKQLSQEVKDAKLSYFKEDIAKLEQQAQALEEKGNIDDAISNYEKVLENKNDNQSLDKLKELFKKKKDDSIKVYVNGKKPEFDVKPFVKEGRTLVPIRQIAEALEAKVDWDETTQTVTITKGDKIVKLSINSDAAKIGKKDVKIDVPATIFDGRTVVPLRFVSEALDSNVNWDDETKLITVEQKEDDDLDGNDTTDTQSVEDSVLQ